MCGLAIATLLYDKKQSERVFCNVLIVNVSYTDLACHNSDYKKSKKL